MSEMVLPEALAARLRQFADQEGRSPEEVLESMFSRYLPEPAEEEALALRQIKLRIYEQARRYWREVGDTERLSLTDEALDEQFWLIDPDGIPRLKSEQGTIEIPPDPLLAMSANAQQKGYYSDRDDVSENFKEYIAEFVSRKRRQDEE